MRILYIEKEGFFFKKKYYSNLVFRASPSSNSNLIGMWQQKMESQEAAVKAEEQGRLQREVTRKQVPSHTAGKEVLVTGDKKQEQHRPQEKILPKKKEI